MIWYYLLILIIAVTSMHRGNQTMKKAILVQDEAERVALMRLGKRTWRFGQVVLILWLVFLLAGVGFVLYAVWI